jgi:NADH dehydrogenase/NADH:ubiquinone oxidoreductase subunit G
MMPNSATADRGLGAATPQGAAGASTGTLTLSMDGQAIRVRRGATLLEAARAAGIHIPTLCHHDALEPHGACRLCVVDISRPAWGDEPRMVAACIYPAEHGLVVQTASERVRAARREILDLLLARCPESPLIRCLALDYGIRETSYRQDPEPTDCILCDLCTRLCDRLGHAAISLVRRGIGREVATPFHEPPPDCVGCLACAVICPTGHIPVSSSDAGHTIWGRTFARLRCPTCGRAHITEAQADYWAAHAGLSRADLETCDACKRTATVETIARLAAIG